MEGCWSIGIADNQRVGYSRFVSDGDLLLNSSVLMDFVRGR